MHHVKPQRVNEGRMEIMPTSTATIITPGIHYSFMKLLDAGSNDLPLSIKNCSIAILYLQIVYALIY